VPRLSDPIPAAPPPGETTTVNPFAPPQSDPAAMVTPAPNPFAPPQSDATTTVTPAQSPFARPQSDAVTYPSTPRYDPNTYPNSGPIPVLPQQTAQYPVMGHPSGQFPVQNEPLPGERYPAAVLPGGEYHPSGPIPVLPPPSGPFPAQAPPSMYPAPRPRKPRNKPVMILTVALVFFVLASGALGTLWLVEQGNHKGTSSELQTVRDNLTKTQNDLKATRESEANASNAQHKAERDAEINKPCLDAARAFIRATNAADAQKRWDAMIDVC
jgi:hypothetical protein